MKSSIVSLGIRTFDVLSKKQRSDTAKNIAISILQASLEVISLAAIIPLLYQFIDVSSSKSDSEFLAAMHTLASTYSWQVILVSIVILFLLKNILMVWIAQVQSNFINELYLHFSERIYQQFYNQGWTKYVRENSAEAFRKIRTTPYDFANHILFNFLQLVTEGLICILMIGSVSWADYHILFILSALSIPVFIFHHSFRKSIIKKIDTSFRETTPQSNILLAQGIDSFAEAKIYRKENFFVRHFMETIALTSKQLSKLKTYANLPARILEAVGVMMLAGIIFYNKLNPIVEQRTLLLLALFSVAMYRIVPSINKILISLSQIQAYAYSVSEVSDMVKTETTSRFMKASVSFENEIVFKNVSFHYSGLDRSPLLKDINVKINKGDFVIVTGPSGVGKTTLLHLIAGLISEYAGEITIDGKVLSPETHQSWQSNIGLVPQATVVLQDTLLRNIAFAENDEDIDINRLESAIRYSELSEFIAHLPMQLKTPIGENGLTLSGGQRQRLVLARALYRNPSVLLLDEVVNQLDEENKVKILRILKDLTQKGKTIILASHDLTAKSFATRIFCVNDMTLVEMDAILI